MMPHIFAQMVNEVRGLAKQYGHTEQFRCRVADLLNEYIPVEHGDGIHGAQTTKVNISNIQAQRSQAERVVVPELTEADVRTALMSNAIDVDVEGVTPRLNRILASRVHSVPASRVLKVGEVAVRNAEWEAAGNLLFSARAAWVECETSGECDMSAVTKAAKAWDALRAQGKERP